MAGDMSNIRIQVLLLCFFLTCTQIDLDIHQWCQIILTSIPVELVFISYQRIMAS